MVLRPGGRDAAAGRARDRMGHRGPRRPAASRGGAFGLGQVVAAPGRADAAADRAGDPVRADGHARRRPGRGDGRTTRGALGVLGVLGVRAAPRHRGPVRGGFRPGPGRGPARSVHPCDLRARADRRGDPGAAGGLLRSGPALSRAGRSAPVQAGRPRADDRGRSPRGDRRAGQAGSPRRGGRAGRAIAAGPGPEDPERPKRPKRPKRARRTGDPSRPRARRIAAALARPAQYLGTQQHRHHYRGGLPGQRRDLPRDDPDGRRRLRGTAR